MSRRIDNFVVDKAVALYAGGMSLKAVAAEVGISRPALTSALRARNVPIISISERQRRWYETAPDEQRKARVAAANTAVRGRLASHAELSQRAKTVESRQIGLNDTERDVIELLSKAGFHGTPLAACGPYNIDIGLRNELIGVEIFGGNFHAYGRHKRRTERRYKYLADAGWRFVVVWVFAEHRQFMGTMVGAIASTIRTVKDGAFPAGSWWVLRGDGTQIASGTGDFAKIAKPISKAQNLA